jgi:DNA invertase Pin-like site-specific DNA recombinase
MTRGDLPAAPGPFAHKIRPMHLDRLAVVYVRQSSPHQVAENRESADLQYQLRRRAVELGWPEPRVRVIDDDQGCSGLSIDNRPGFQRLLAEVSLGHVGIVFGREMSRLARSNRDWHQLLELCALFQVLPADADGVYDPRDVNDRLLLGLKGTHSEAETHVLRTQLHQGKLNKARRGELFTCVPIGYVRSADGGIALDPDEQVRSVIAMVFDLFAELGSVPKVHAHLVAHGICIGMRACRGPGRGQLIWRPARRGTLYETLRHPAYAGAYVYGRNPCDPTLRAAGRSKSGRRTARPDEWVCLLKGRIPAYIPWERYEANRRQMQENDRGRGTSRASRGRGPTLLNGLVTCGRCGRPMAARNARPTAHPRYVCDSQKQEYGGPLCQSASAAAIDRRVEELVLRAVEPAALELSLRAAERIEQGRGRLHRHWRQALERSEYEANRARRQYDSVDPENRLVARELERQWEQKLAERRRLDEEYARFQHEQPRHLTAADRERIRALAADVPALWQAPTTTMADRRAIVRQLVERVVVTRHGTTEVIEVVIRWLGGSESRHEVHQGLRRYDGLGGYAELKDRVRELRAAGRTGGQIAEVLNQEGYRTPRGGPFTGHRVRRLFMQLGLARVPAGVRGPGDLPGKGEWWLPDLAAELGVRPIVVHRWRWSGWLRGRQLPGANGRWIVWADRSELQRLRRLRSYELKNRGRKAPAKLTIPKERRDVGPRTKRTTTRTRSDT